MEILKINTKTVYCVGDLHGNFNDIPYFIKNNDISDAAILFCGDVGIGFHKPDYYSQTFGKIKNELEKRNIYLLFIRGNHDSVAEFNGNTYKDERIRTLRDYTVTQVYGIEDKEFAGESFNVLSVGGAISIDRTWRLTRMERSALIYMHHHGCDYDEAFRKCQQEYWTGEEPFFDKEKLDELRDSGIKIDAVCTHTCPHFCIPYTKDGIAAWFKVDDRLEADLDHERMTMTNIYERLLEDKHPIGVWCYGHYHFHDFYVIDNTKFYLLDMDRNGKMDYAIIKAY